MGKVIEVRTIFFDFGGTLAKPLTDLRPVIRAAALRAGVRVPWELLLREESRAWQELWDDAPAYLGRLPSFADVVHERALRRAGAEGPIESMVQTYRTEQLSGRWHPPYPETGDVLRTLRRRGYRLHVLSNHTDYLPIIVRNLGWSELFAGVTFSQEVGAEKPDPRVFGWALRRARCAGPEALHVGDLWDTDYRGARDAGLRAIWLNRDGARAPGPCDEIRDLRELLARLPGPSAGVEDRIG